MISIRFTFVALVLLSFSAVAHASEFTVDSWVIQSIVDIGGQQGSSSSFEPSNPYSETLLGFRENSSASSIVNAAWTPDGVFDLHAVVDHACQGDDDNTSCRSTGAMLFAPHVDSILSVNAEYNYAMAAGDRETILSISSISGEPGNPQIIDFFSRRLTLGGDSTGQITFQSPDIFLAAGFPYSVSYRLDSRSFTGNANDLSLADGFVSIAVRPVPEPTTACLAALVFAPFVVRKPKHLRY